VNVPGFGRTVGRIRNTGLVVDPQVSNRTSDNILTVKITGKNGLMIGRGSVAVVRSLRDREFHFLWLDQCLDRDGFSQSAGLNLGTYGGGFNQMPIFILPF